MSAETSKRRWSTTLVVSLLLFVLNWGVWAYKVVIERDWSLTPIEAHLRYMEANQSLFLAQLTSCTIAIFLIVLSFRIYLYFLLLEYDSQLGKEVFTNHPKWRLRVEFILRCAAIIAVNFIYYSSTRRLGNFQSSLVVTTALVFLWDLVMVKRLYTMEAFKAVFQRDFFLLVFALIYLFLENHQVGQAYTPIPFVIIATVAVTLFWTELTSTYWSVITRACKSMSLVGEPH